MHSVVGGLSSAFAAPSAIAAELSPIGQLGRSIFFNTNLTVNGNQSCPACPDPAAGFFGPFDAFNAASAVVEPSVPGIFANRKPASSAYASAHPVRFADVRGDDPVTEVPAALTDQCANPDAKIEIACKALAASIDDAFDRIAISIGKIDTSEEMSPFSSRFDAWIAGNRTHSEEELCGFELFEAEDKGNCAARHVLTPAGREQRAVFTDRTFDNSGVPRNRDNPQARTMPIPGRPSSSSTIPYTPPVRMTLWAPTGADPEQSRQTAGAGS